MPDHTKSQSRIAELEAERTALLKENSELRADRDSFQRMFGNACETLGAVQAALGGEGLAGYEPELAGKAERRA